jgi:hypothetical protein
MAVLIAFDFTQATESAMGFSNSRAAVDPDGRTTRTVQVGAGPSGANTIRWVHNPISMAAVTTIGNPQNTHGSAIGRTAGYTGVPPGGSMFLHLYVRLLTNSNLAVWDPGPTLNTGDFCTYKMAIWGDNNGGNDARLILQAKMGSAYGGMRLYFADNVNNGPGDPSSYPEFSITDGWTAMIFEAKSNTSVGSNDAVLRTWKNSGTQGSPGATLTAQSLDSVDAATGLTRLWTGAGFNDFGNETLAQNTPTPALSYEIGGYVLRDDLDSSWFANMTGGGGGGGTQGGRGLIPVLL